MNKAFSSLILFRCLALLSMFTSLFAGCSFLQVSEDVNTLRKSVVFVGIVSSPLSFQDTPIIVAAYSNADSMRTIVHYTTLHEPGPYELMLPVGIYNIVAFGDKNKNLIYDRGEPAGQIISAGQVSAPARGVIGNLDIVILDENSKKIDLPHGFKIPPKEYTKFHSTCPGAVAKLDDFVFSDEFGGKGLWNSVEFFREIGGNIYFLDEYDPTKIPILFVHGAAGSPQNWRTFIKEVDRDKYQPWFFYYPSGSAIDSMSHLLLWKLQNLQRRYKFKELYITAHSMGGLVVRSFLVNYGQYFPFITNFISISTPWGGEELAEMGVKYAPAVIPAWRDMQPGSEFFDSLYRRRMPPTVDYYLFFGHKGNRNILRPNNDKVVTLASQLDERSQREAKMIYGFNEDHVSILSSRQVISHYNALLADIYRKSNDSDAIPGNRLFVDFSFDFPKELPRPVSALYLRPVDEKGDVTWSSLSPDDTGRELGPFPSGNYEVSVISPAFVPEPVSIPVIIQEGTVPRVQFAMKPSGFVRGYVAKNEQPYMQAGNDRQPDAEVEIRSITLEGNGFSRTLIPLKEEEISYDELFADHYLSATDFSSEGTFFFFGLPAGEYKLTITATGHKIFSRMCTVTPGQYTNTMIIELVKDIVDPR